MAPKRKQISYKDAGVDVDANDELVDLIKPIVRSTYGPRVVDRHGGFAGLFRLDYREDLFKRNYKDPILVSCTDGVGSKVLLAVESKHCDTVGIDCVAMSVNDMVTMGAEPLFFLDYIGLHKLDPKRTAEIIEGVAAGCRESGCALLGGETAEMPEVYDTGHFDLVGFAVGAVERKRVIDGTSIESGDVIIGLPSSGIHSNGLTLARRLVFKEARLKYDSVVEAIGSPIGDELLKPTRIYVRPVVRLLRRYRVKRVVRGMAHITGGGLPGNVPRIIPDGLTAHINTKTWTVPPIFKYLQSIGVKRDEMFRTFNMGIGFVVVVRPTFANAVIGHFRRQGFDALAIGKIRKGSEGVALA